MNSFINLEHTLNNIDKDTLVSSLYQRDLIKNYNNQEQIINCLKKLNYYTIDLHQEQKKFILDFLNNIISYELKKDWDSDIKNKSIFDLIEYIKNTSDYQRFEYNLNYRISRAFILSKYINNSNSTFIFYNDLSIEELTQLDY
jgi:hypothetical protein